MKTPILIPLAFEFDSSAEKSTDAFGFSDRQKLEMLLALGRRIRGKDEDDLSLAQETFMELRDEGTIPDGLFFHLAVIGLQEIWENYADGILLMLDAEAENGNL